MAAQALFAPLAPSAFESVVHQQQFLASKKALLKGVTELLVKAYPQLAEVKQQCRLAGCTDTSCPLHRGALLFRVDSLLPQEPGTVPHVSAHWCSMLQLTQLLRPAVVHSVLSMDPSTQVMVVILVPSQLLGELLRPEAVPPVGLVGTAVCELSAMAQGLVHLCFLEAVPHIPEGVMHIADSHLCLDPTNPDKLPAHTCIEGLDSALHNCLAELPWAAPVVDVPLTAAVQLPAAAAGDDDATGYLSGVVEAGMPQDSRQDSWALQGGAQASFGQCGHGAVLAAGAKDNMDKPSTSTAGAGAATAGATTAAAAAAGLLTPEQQRAYLQRTINKFWLTVTGMAQRLTNRVRKVRCRGQACDGITCEQCRGMMVFTVGRLEGPSHVWAYTHDGSNIDSDAPKQYLRGRWCTPYDLVQKLGCQDLRLLKAAMTHDRHKGYIQVLHIPHLLVRDFLPAAPHAGLVFWRVYPHSDLLGSILPPPSQPLAPVLETTLDDGADEVPAAMQPSSTSALQPEQNGGQELQHGGGTSEEQTGSGGIVGAGSRARSAASSTPRRCCAPGCGLCEDRFTGVRLLQCSGCKQAAYCMREHQAADWRTHAQMCPGNRPAVPR